MEEKLAEIENITESLISVRAYCFSLLSKTGIIGLFLFAKAINQNEFGEKQNDLHYRPVTMFLCLSENTVVFLFNV